MNPIANRSIVCSPCGVDDDEEFVWPNVVAILIIGTTINSMTTIMADRVAMQSMGILLLPL
jgi:hypothetical protein